ncbi:caspase domain-containing protein [Cladorrhinum sp. PSN259]|nr:caspase domain-containing protein [Cladorrhinum sp. PSN259]
MVIKKALLIASGFGGLRGTQNDVDKMARVLGDLGFSLSLCCGTDATRDGMLKAWRKLADESTPGDCIVVYYSGHGGVVSKPKPRGLGQLFSRDWETTTRWRHQFLVPTDFGTSAQGGSQNGGVSSFGGILDVEISHLLRDMTDRTQNITVILDCCFAGSMARDPGRADGAVPKGGNSSLSSVSYSDVSGHIDSLRQRGQVPQDTHADENPFVVRIAAATASETAWEYRNSQGEWCGAMTEALSQVLAESIGPDHHHYHRLTWRTALMRVSEMVNARFPYQHPQVEGPRHRLPFSTSEDATEALHIREEQEDGRVVIQAGRISGVREGNTYSVMPFGSEKPVPGEELATALVTEATAFKATVGLSPGTDGTKAIPAGGALAFLQYSTLYRWPVVLPPELPWLREMVSASRFVRPAEPRDEASTLAEFSFSASDGLLTLRNGCGHVLAATSSADLDLDAKLRLVQWAEQLSRGQHLLSLECETEDDVLVHAMEVTFGLVGAALSRGKDIPHDGAGHLFEDDLIYIELFNHGTEKVYAWIFDVNARGNIGRISRSNHTGAEVPSNLWETLGYRNDGLGLKGLPIRWPKGLPRTAPLEETLVFIFTNLPVDLNHLSDTNSNSLADRTRLSQLEQLTYRIATGEGRRTVTIDEGGNQTRYAILHIPFLLHPKAVPSAS